MFSYSKVVGVYAMIFSVVFSTLSPITTYAADAPKNPYEAEKNIGDRSIETKPLIMSETYPTLSAYCKIDTKNVTATSCGRYEGVRKQLEQRLLRSLDSVSKDDSITSKVVRLIDVLNSLDVYNTQYLNDTPKRFASEYAHLMFIRLFYEVTKIWEYNNGEAINNFLETANSDVQHEDQSTVKDKVEELATPASPSLIVYDENDGQYSRVSDARYNNREREKKFQLTIKIDGMYDMIDGSTPEDQQYTLAKQCFLVEQGEEALANISDFSSYLKQTYAPKVYVLSKADAIDQSIMDAINNQKEIVGPQVIIVCDKVDTDTGASTGASTDTTTDSTTSSAYPQWMFVVQQKDVDGNREDNNIYVFDTIRRNNYVSKSFSADYADQVLEAYGKDDYESQNNFCYKFIYNVAAEPYTKDDKPRIFVRSTTTPTSVATYLADKDLKDGTITQDEYKERVASYMKKGEGYDVYGCVSVDSLPPSDTSSGSSSSSSVAITPDNHYWVFSATTDVNTSLNSFGSYIYTYSSLFANYGFLYAYENNAIAFNQILQNAVVAQEKGQTSDFDKACKTLVHTTYPHYIYAYTNNGRDYSKFKETPRYTYNISIGNLTSNEVISEIIDWNIYHDYINTHYTFVPQNITVSDQSIKDSLKLAASHGMLHANNTIINKTDTTITNGGVEYKPGSTVITMDQRMGTDRKTIVCAPSNSSFGSSSSSSTPTTTTPAPTITTMVLGYHLENPETMYLQTIGGWESSDAMNVNDINNLVIKQDFDSMNQVCKKVFSNYIESHPEEFKKYVPQTEQEKTIRQRFRAWMTGDNGLGNIRFVLVKTKRTDAATTSYFASQGVPVPSSMYQCLPVVSEGEIDDVGSSVTDMNAGIGKHDIAISDVKYVGSDKSGNPNYNINLNPKAMPINTPFAVVFTIKNKGPKGGNIDGIDFALTKEGDRNSLKPIQQAVSCSHVNGVTTKDTIYLAPSNAVCTVTVTYLAKDSGIYNFVALAKTKIDEKRIELDVTNNSLATRFVVTKERVNGKLKNSSSDDADQNTKDDREAESDNNGAVNAETF